MQGALWTAPAIAIASAAPAAANSAPLTAGLPNITTLSATLTFASLQAGPQIATDNGAGYVLNGAPTGWVIASRTATTVTLIRTDVAPGANVGFTGLAVRGTGGNAALTGVIHSGTDANYVNFRIPLTVTKPS